LVDSSGERDYENSEGLFVSETYVSETLASINANYKKADTQLKRSIVNDIY
jgi:hypothetical protein